MSRRSGAQPKAAARQPKRKSRPSAAEMMRRKHQSETDKPRATAKPKAQPRPQRQAQRGAVSSQPGQRKRQYALARVPPHRMLTRHEDIRAHEYFDIHPTWLDKVWIMYWPNNETKTVFLFREKDGSDVAVDFESYTIGQPAAVNMQSFGSSSAIGQNIYTTDTGNIASRSTIMPTSEITMGGEPSRVLGGSLKMRLQFASTQSVTMRYMVMDDDVALSVAPSDVRGSDFAASVTVKPNVWMTIRPELRQPPQQQVFHTIEAQPNSSNATYWPIVIVFMNVRSPDPPYGANFTGRAPHQWSDDCGLKNPAWTHPHPSSCLCASLLLL